MLVDEEQTEVAIDGDIGGDDLPVLKLNEQALTLLATPVKQVTVVPGATCVPAAGSVLTTAPAGMPSSKASVRSPGSRPASSS